MNIERWENQSVEPNLTFGHRNREDGAHLHHRSIFADPGMILSPFQQSAESNDDKRSSDEAKNFRSLDLDALLSSIRCNENEGRKTHDLSSSREENRCVWGALGSRPDPRHRAHPPLAEVATGGSVDGDDDDTVLDIGVIQDLLDSRAAAEVDLPPYGRTLYFADCRARSGTRGPRNRVRRRRNSAIHKRGRCSKKQRNSLL